MKRKRVGNKSKNLRIARKKFIRKLLMIIFIVLLVMNITLLMSFILDKLKTGKEAGLKGELPSLGILGVDETTGIYFPENCGDSELIRNWESIFLESSAGLVIHSNKDASESCSSYLMYKILDNDRVYLVHGTRTDNGYNFQHYILGIYGNLTSNSINFLGLIDNSNVDVYTTYLFIRGLAGGVGVEGYRNISSITEANNEFSRVFLVKNGTWRVEEGDIANLYYFSNLGNGVVYENLTLDGLEYHIHTNKPINLTQTNEIEDIEINGSNSYAYTLYLNSYFDNLGYEDNNLSFSYAVNEVPFGNVMQFEELNKVIYFDTSNTLGGNFTMNITLSHPSWKEGENITTNNFKVTIRGCLDSDNNIEIYEKGTARNLTTNGTDYCISNTNVMEYFCTAGYVKNSSHSCGSQSSCNDGRCISNASISIIPEFLDVCHYLVWEMNKSYNLGMETCFSDDKNESLSFRYDNLSDNNLTISQSGSELTLTPKTNWNGTGYFFIYANDTYNETRGLVNFEVFKVINRSSTNTTNNQTNTTTPPPKINTYSPSNEKINISSNGSAEFSISAENYQHVRWYVDGVLVRSDVVSYSIGDLSEGEHEIKVEVVNGTRVDTQIWGVFVAEIKESPKTNWGDYFWVIFVLIGGIILIVVILIIKNMAEKESSTPRPVIKELRPGIRVGYLPPLSR